MATDPHREDAVGLISIFEDRWWPLSDRDRRTEAAPDRDRNSALRPYACVPAGRAEADGGERPEPPEPCPLDDD